MRGRQSISILGPRSNRVSAGRCLAPPSPSQGGQCHLGRGDAWIAAQSAEEEIMFPIDYRRLSCKIYRRVQNDLMNEGREEAVRGQLPCV